ncbi:transposase [Streptomyces sp. NPDC001868]|uniref:transposase n=1 Tax=Streptomyces sp. NPDC001868 TaxID=3154401 RepID=UPI003320858A
MVLRRLPSLAFYIRVASFIRMPTSHRANLRRTLKSCSRALVNDQSWELLAPLLPPWPDEGARSAAGAGSAVPAGHLVRAAYRIGWEDLPQELGFRSGMTCWRRIKRWINAGVFDDLYRILLAQLNAAIDAATSTRKRGSRTLSSPPFLAPT